MGPAGRVERLAGLDGLRALAITATIWMHLEVQGWFSTGLSRTWGRQGVALFFVLSGFLITRNLLQGGGLPRFYWRRVWRIFPPYYAYLALVAGLWATGFYQLQPWAFVSAATFWTNWSRTYLDLPLEHTWSLAVEEQYYLAWPLLLRWLGPMWASRALGLALICWPLQRGLRTGQFGHPSWELALFSVTYDLLLWGSLGALLQLRMRSGWWLGLAVASLVSLGWAAAVWVPALRGLGFTVLVLWIAEHPLNRLTRFLEVAPLRWLGTRSYSLYLWHVLFLDPRLRGYFSWPAVVVLALLCAEVTYRWIEEPSRRQGARRPFSLSGLRA